MNKSLFTFVWHGLLSVVVCLAFTGWLLAKQYQMGTRGVTENVYVLWSGWVAFGLMVVVTLYALRKYIHRIGMSFETKNPVSIKRLEKAEGRLTEIKRSIVKGKLTSKGEVKQMAERVLKEEGVMKVAKVVVRDGNPGEPSFVVEVMPTEPLGRVAKWMHAHIWYGMASGVIVLFHGGMAMESPLGIAMNFLTYLVIFTGILGTIVWALGPRWIMAREKDISFEESYVLNAGLTGKIEGLYEKLKDAPEVVTEFKRVDGATSKVDTVTYDALQRCLALKPDLKAIMQDLTVLICQRARIIGALKQLNRVKALMNWWRIVHIPASVLLLGIVVVHILSVWWY